MTYHLKHIILEIPEKYKERWLSGLKRLPAKQVSGETWIKGSNPFLSTIIFYK
jgi:hypothetical protein